MIPSERPYEAAAMSLLSKGWPPIPIPARQKDPPPVGYTGYEGTYPSGPDVQAWIEDKGDWSVAIRFPRNVVGIDVDNYSGKPGAVTLSEAETRLGPLPPTYRCTSRRDGVSSIRVYRVRRSDRQWADKVGPGIELLHYGHRYMMTAPSLHRDSGDPYLWYDPAGTQCSAPAVDEVPFLPSIWEEDLDRGHISERAAKADLTVDQAQGLLDGYPQGPMCAPMQRLIRKAESDLAAAASRHDTVRNIVGAIVRIAEMGHNGSKQALQEVHQVWLAALQFGEKRTPDPGEFERMVTGAIAIVSNNPTPEADRGCCGGGTSGGVVFVPPAGFWECRPELEVIHQYARARMAAPWAVLLCALARVVAVIPPRVVLPPVIGGECSLNLFVALVGAPGAGKGAAEAVAAEAIVLPEIHVGSVGSGEGIAHMYKHREKGRLVPDRDAVLFSIPEVDTLTALGNRQGATLLPQLRSAYMGEQLGFGTADITRRIPLLPHEYRMSIILSVQPERADRLMSDAGGGTPQRFIFGSVVDRDAPPPDQLPPEPAPWHWALEDRYRILPSLHGNTHIAYCEQVHVAIRGNRWAQNKGETGALDGHLMLARLKIAAALGILNGRLSVNEQDWELSDVVLKMNLATRNGIEQVLTSVTRRSNEAKAHAEADRVSIVENRSHVERVERVAKRIVKTLSKAEEATAAYLKRGISSRDRDAFAEAIELLLDDGRITESGDGYILSGESK